MQVHRTRHTHAYVQIPNGIARHASLSLEAVGLLTRLLSLPNVNGATVERITALVPNGRRSVSNAMNELIVHGYLKRARVQDPETGRWVTLTSVTDSPSDHLPTVGGPTSQAVGGSSKEEKTVGSNDLPTVPERRATGARSAGTGEGHKSPLIEEGAPATADPVTGRAIECLRSVGRIEPMLKLSVRDSLRLAPLAAQWLQDGYREMEVIKAVTRSLPASVESAAAFVSYRLRNQTERVNASAETPKAAPVERAKCPRCDVIFPLGHPGGICRNCR